MYDVGVVIGKFQPIHNGHVNLIRKALEVSNHVHIIIGHSGFQDFKHFLSPSIVKDLLSSIFKKEILDNRITMSIVLDMNSNKLWVKKVLKEIKDINCGEDIVLVGGSKEVGWYKELFPKVDLLIKGYDGVNTKDLRKNILCKVLGTMNGTQQLPKEMLDFLSAYAYTSEFKEMRKRYVEYYNLQSIVEHGNSMGIY